LPFKRKVCSADIAFLLKNIKELACPPVTHFEHLAKGHEFTVLRKIKKGKVSAYFGIYIYIYIYIKTEQTAQ
jgi:hypothetical protein